MPQLHLLQELNELQAYILVKRWSTSQATVPAELSSEQLQDLQSAYWSQRSYLLRSIEELLTASGHEQYAQLTDKALHKAIEDKLEQNLSQSLTHSLASIAADSHVQHRQAAPWVQQGITEQEDLLSLMICLYSRTTCHPEVFQQTADSLHQHVFQSLKSTELATKSAYLVRADTGCCHA